jgi:hypothetical protein
MWTAPALASERRRIAGQAWRVVESQARIATMKLVDNLDEQALLEAELERGKPTLPPACAGLHWLLATPFRYAPYPYGSRFRRARQRDGCLYAAERIETAIAEDAFYRLRFLLDAPGATQPANPLERTAFSFRVQTEAAIDLTQPPLDADRALWTDPIDYAACQTLADTARAAGVSLLRYASVRDPAAGANWAVLDCAAFVPRQPDIRQIVQYQTWRYMLRPDRIEAVCEMPPAALAFGYAGWAAVDRRIPARLG